jgi:phenylpropionate dioxygenase-like ring-hydroxylating dioxygenase large terminal subunit
MRSCAPIHGWRYRADGRCVAIPQLADPSRVPAKARVPAFRAQERYGLVWVALEEPRWPLPEVPELENGSWAVVSAGPYSWQCDAARQVETSLTSAISLGCTPACSVIPSGL